MDIFALTEKAMKAERKRTTNYGASPHFFLYGALNSPITHQVDEVLRDMV